MADNDYRSPWLDWGEPVEETPPTGKSWDEWGEPVDTQTPKAQQPTVTTAAPPTIPVPTSTPLPAAPTIPQTSTHAAPEPTPVAPTVPQTSTHAAPPTPTPTPKPPTQPQTTTYAAEGGSQSCEGRGEAQGAIGPSGQDVKYGPPTTTHAAEGGSQTCEGRGEVQGPLTPSGQDVKYGPSSNGGGSASTSGTGNVGASAGGGSPSLNVPKYITETYTDEHGEKKTRQINNPAYEDAVRRQQEEENKRTTNGGGSASTTGTGNAGASAGGGSPSSNVPKYITETYIDENGEKQTRKVRNPDYDSSAEHVQSQPTGGGGTGYTPPTNGYSAGGGSPSTSGYGTGVTRQYDNNINEPPYIKQEYRDENGELRTRTIPNPNYNRGQNGHSGSGSGPMPSAPTPSGSTPSVPRGGGAGEKKDAYYPDYAAAHATVKGGEYRYYAENLRDSVNTLRSQYNSVMNSMDGWEGMAKGSCKNAVQSIQGKLTVVMNNIDQSLIPACEACEQLDELLTQLESEDEILKDLLLERDLKEDDYNAAKRAYDNEPSTTTKTTKDPTTGEEKKQTVDNPRKADLKVEMNAAKTKWENAIEEVELQQTKEAELCLDIDNLIELIQTLQANIQTMSSYVNPMGSNYNNISSNENINQNYDDIVRDLEESTNHTGVGTGYTDYNDGTPVMFDDGYGYVYGINQGDPQYNDDIPGYDDSYGDKADPQVNVSLEDPKQV